MSLADIPLQTLTGQPTTLTEFAGKAVLLVNVASKCGLTPQYTGLEQLQQQYAERGFTVLGVPCNQFGGRSRAPLRRSRPSARSTTASPSPCWRRSR